MRVPLSWLRDYVDFDLPPERLAERLTLLGLEVQGIERIGADWNVRRRRRAARGRAASAR